MGILHRPIWPYQVNAGVCGLIMTDSIIGFLCFLISAASVSFILPSWNWFYSCIQSNKAVANSSVVWLTVVVSACRHALQISSACWKKLVLPPCVLASCWFISIASWEGPQSIPSLFWHVVSIFVCWLFDMGATNPLDPCGKFLAGNHLTCDFLTTSSLKLRSTLKHFIFRFSFSHVSLGVNSHS